MTNADRIRRMNDEELADLLTKAGTIVKCETCNIPVGENCGGDCKKAYLAWLKEECGGIDGPQ